MHQLNPEQRDLVTSLAKRLGQIPGVLAVVLGGSHARGRAEPTSDIDLGLLYSEAAPFSTHDIRRLADEVNDAPGPMVTDFYQWGPWVNGGAWLTIKGQRVDFLYRSIEHVERVIADCTAGRYEVHFLQQPPFGFFSATYLGEVEVCVPLHDPAGYVERLKQRVAIYPEALREAVIRDYLFMAEFTLTQFAPKYAARGDVFGTAACLTRAVYELAMVLFALNRKYLMNEKTALLEVSEFERAPRDFRARAQDALTNVGATPAELKAAVESISQVVGETADITKEVRCQRAEAQ